jgi:hypothetical protein
LHAVRRRECGRFFLTPHGEQISRAHEEFLQQQDGVLRGARESECLLERHRRRIRMQRLFDGHAHDPG